MSDSSFTTSLLHTIRDIWDKVQPQVQVVQVKKWNDDIEQALLEMATRRDSSAASVIRKVPCDRDGNDNDKNGGSTSTTEEKENGVVTTVEEVSICIHALILRLVEATYTCSLLEKDDAPISIGEESNGKTNTTCTAKSKDISNCSFQTNNDANESTMLLVEQMIEQRSKANCDSTTQHFGNEKALHLLSQLIRASKNLIRWNRLLLAQNKRAKRTSKTGPRHQIYGLDACYRLCSSGMVKLYLTLLEINSEPYDDENNDNDVDEDEDNDNQKSKMNIRNARNEMGKNSCVALFHSTYGEAIEPICKKSLGELTSPSSKIYGIRIIVRLLISSSYTQVTLALIKLVHNLVGSVSGIMNIIDSELKILANSENEKEDQNTQLTTSLVETNLITILVSTLAWSIRSLPPFPGKNSSLDRRSEIAIEIVRVLFALQHKHNTSYKKVNDSNPEVMTQLGVLIVDILHLPNKDKRVYECKVSVLILLMDAPKEFSQFLYSNHCVEPLLTILWLQLNEITVEKEGMVQGQSSAASILPILILLNKLSQANKLIHAKIKEAIFPPERDGELLANYKRNQNSNKSETSYTSSAFTSPSASSTNLSNNTNPNNMNPIDAPRGTLRWKLIQLMTWTESNVKRCASELLWTLCNGNSKEFVARTGFGNAVHMLGIRGLVNIPK